MTQFLKKVVKNRLDMLGINHNNWVDESFSEEERTKREKSKKKSHPSDLVTTGGEVNNSYPDSSDEIANNDMGDQDEGNDNADGVSDIRGGDEEQNVVHDATHVLHDPTQDETLVNDTDESGLSNILKNNGIDLQNISSLNVSSIGDTFPNATSSVSGHTNIPRRFSARQATQHARQTERLASVSESAVQFPPPPISPLSTLSPGHNSSPPEPTPEPSHKFQPRRKPINNPGTNFRSKLNVNIDQNRSPGIFQMHVPMDFVKEFELLSKANTEMGYETGGILAGINKLFCI